MSTPSLDLRRRWRQWGTGEGRGGGGLPTPAASSCPSKEGHGDSPALPTKAGLAVARVHRVRWWAARGDGVAWARLPCSSSSGGGWASPAISSLELLIPDQLVRIPWRWAAAAAAGWCGDGAPLLACPSSSPACSLSRELPASILKSASH
jgi:hypothetical protein